MLFGNFGSLVGCRNTRISRLGACKSLHVIFSRDLEPFVLYYVMGVSVPSLHRESTDSLIYTLTSTIKVVNKIIVVHINYNVAII